MLRLVTLQSRSRRSDSIQLGMLANLHCRSLTVLAAGFFLLGGGVLSAAAADYGRLSGTISAQQGHPLMGASVIVIGPTVSGLRAVESRVQRVITDANGRFAVERLVPGWYSIQAVSATRLPVLRSRVRVEAGRTSVENFVLGDILASLRLEVPRDSVSNWGEDWKWVLRTSATTRPVLRYQEVAEKTKAKTGKSRRQSCQRLIGVMPGSSRGEALAADLGFGSVLAYVRPLSDDGDLLVAGLMGANGLQASSLATAFRRDIFKGDPVELALVVHQLRFAEGIPLASGDSRESLEHAQALVLSYAHTRRISDSITVTAGMEIDYLNALQDVVSARSSARLEYRMTPSSLLVVRYGAMQPDEGASLMERIGALNAFPRVTMRGYRPRLEKLKHAEVSYRRKLGKASHIEIAAYRDQFENTAVWGFASSATALEDFAGDFLPNPAADGVTLNAGNYSSSGLRAAYVQDFGGHVKAAFLYSLGDALAVGAHGLAGEGPRPHLRASLHPVRTQSFAGNISTVIPMCKTQVISSYEWLPEGRVTGVDPYGQSSLQLQPYLGLQIRQPLPPLGFFPARIEALADFRNLLAQGYVPLAGSGDDGLLLTPVYRSFRGGFSVQF